nr:transposase [uncultured Pseudomonas sp.]
MIQYPAELPLPLQNGYGLQTPVDPMLRTPMVSGRARQRVVFTDSPEHVGFTWNFNQNEAAFFRAWYARTLGYGVEWFSLTLLLPEGFKQYECRFTGKPDGPRLVQISRWEMSATLELREPSLIPPGWENFPQYWLMMDIIDLAINREWPEA